jgi:hypothetical protein
MATLAVERAALTSDAGRTGTGAVTSSGTLNVFRNEA